MPKYGKIDIGIGQNTIVDPTQASVNGIVSDISIGDKGKVIDLFKHVVDSHATNYDPLTDNLLARRRFGGSVEVFGYDELDRLTSVSTSTATTVTGTGVLTEVMNITYASNGNILSKTGVGEYTYNDQFKPHAVISVDNTDGLMSTARLNTTFNDLGKIQTIGDAGQYRNMDFVYGPDQQRWYSVMTKHGAVEREIVYAGDYEKVTEGGITREFYYLDGGAIIVKQNGEFKPYQAFTDNLGSILSVVDEKGEKVFEASYDAWGKQTKNLKFTNMLNLHRGYTGHEMLNEFGIINMNGRLYDPVLGRFFSPDNYVQMPDNSQNFNRYSYCLNNPLKYTDPSGELWWLAPIIGAYLGGSAANEEFNPLKWDFGNWKTYAGMAVGGLSAAAGAAIASSGAIMANTMSIAISSFIYSVGTNLYTGGESPVSINFGFCSYDVTNDNFGYLGKKGNSSLENFSYAMGLMANVSDVLMGSNPQNIDLVTEHSDPIGHSAIVNYGTKTMALDGYDPNSLISVGPIQRATIKELNWIRGTNRWLTYSRDGVDVWRQTIKVNYNTIKRYASWLNRLDNENKLIYSLGFSSCVTHTSIALNLSGVFNIGIHPMFLNAQMYLWNNGVRLWMYSSFLTN